MGGSQSSPDAACLPSCDPGCFPPQPCPLLLAAQPPDGLRRSSGGGVGSVIRGMAGRGELRSYPYPRHHSTLVLLPRGGVPVLPPRPLPNFDARPPLNRACPPIPESRSDDSLRTASSLSTSASKHAIHSPTTPDACVVIQNIYAAPLIEEDEAVSPRLDQSQSSDSIRTSPISPPRPPKSASSPQIARKAPASPLLAAANRVRSKLVSRFSHSPGLGRKPSPLTQPPSPPAATKAPTDHNGNHSKTKIPALAKESKLKSPKPPWRGGGGSKRGSGRPHLPFHFRPKPKVVKKVDEDRLSTGRSPLLSRKSPSPSTLRRATVAPSEERSSSGSVTSLPKQRPSLLGLGAGPAAPIGSKASPAAPLAESESSTIENSPAVELPPAPFPSRHCQPPWMRRVSLPKSPLVLDPSIRADPQSSSPRLPTQQSATGCRQATAFPSAPCTALPDDTSTNTCVMLHSRRADEIGTRRSLKKPPIPPPKPPKLTDFGNLASPTVALESSWLDALSSPLLRDKREESEQTLVDVLGSVGSSPDRRGLNSASELSPPPRASSHRDSSTHGGASSASSAAESSKVTSPSSEHRGLIDDEIRDQPDLVSLASRSPGEEEASDAEGKRAAFSALSASLVSGASLDGDEGILDYDPFTSSFSSSFSASWRRSSRSAGGKMLRRSSTLRSTGTRDSLDVAMDELKNIVSHISMEADQMTALGQEEPRLRPPTTPLNTTLAAVPLDPHLYRSMCQDVTVVKTLLLRLKTELSKTETLSPFTESVGPPPEEPGPSAAPPPSPPHPPAAAETRRLRDDNAALRAEVHRLKAELARKDASLQRIHQASLQVGSRGGPGLEVDEVGTLKSDVLQMKMDTAV